MKVAIPEVGNFAIGSNRTLSKFLSSWKSQFSEMTYEHD